MKFYSLFIISSSLIFPSTSNFALCYTCFTSFSSKPIAKLKKWVGQSKPLSAKLEIVKNTSSKLKRRSHRIASKLELEIEKAEEEVSMHREEIVFTDESKNQGSLAAFEGGHSFTDLSELEDGHFSACQGSIGQTSPTLLLSIPLVSTSLFPSIYPFLFSLPLSFTSLSLVYLAS